MLGRCELVALVRAVMGLLVAHKCLMERPLIGVAQGPAAPYPAHFQFEAIVSTAVCRLQIQPILPLVSAIVSGVLWLWVPRESLLLPGLPPLLVFLPFFLPG